jgi:hypothetical protein
MRVLEGSRGNRRNRVRPERRGDGEERRADYEEPQRNLLQKAIHAGDDRQKGGEEEEGGRLAGFDRLADRMSEGEK